MAGYWKDVTDLMTTQFEEDAGLRERTPRPPRAPKAAPTPAAPQPVEFPTWRIVTMEFDQVDVNTRRRIRRWLARQPIGPEHPVLRYRRGNVHVGDGHYDFLDIGVPEGSEHRRRLDTEMNVHQMSV